MKFKDEFGRTWETDYAYRFSISRIATSIAIGVGAFYAAAFFNEKFAIDVADKAVEKIINRSAVIEIGLLDGINPAFGDQEGKRDIISHAFKCDGAALIDKATQQRAVFGFEDVYGGDNGLLCIGNLKAPTNVVCVKLPVAFEGFGGKTFNPIQNGRQIHDEQ